MESTGDSIERETAGKSDLPYRQLIDGIGTGVIVTQYGRLMFVNQRVRDLSGYEEPELDGRSIFDFIHSADRDRMAALYLAKVNGKPVPPGNRFRIITKAGNARWVQCESSLLTINGKPAVTTTLVDCEAQEQAEQALRGSEERYRNLFENLPLPACYFDAGGHPVDINAAALRILGVTQAQFFDENCSSHANQWLAGNRLPFSKDAHPISRALSTREAVRDEIAGIYNQNEKKIVWFNAHALPLLAGNEDTPEQVLVTLFDLAELNRSQQALKESERRFKEAALRDRDLVYEWDIPGGRLEWLGDIDAALGFETNELSRTRDAWEARIHPEDRVRLQTKLTNSWNRRRSVLTKYRVGKKDGSWLYWEERLKIQYSSDGQQLKAIGVCSDITEKQRSEKALKESHERFFTVLNSIDATVSVIDLHTYEILFMNQHGIDEFGEDFTGQICYGVFRGHSEPCAHCTNSWLLSEKGEPAGVCQWEGMNQKTGGYYLNYDRAIKWVDGRYVRLQVATDITRQKKMEKEQEDIRNQLSRTQRMEAIGILAGGIAHDFNNILSIIRGYSEMALMEAEPGSRQRDHLVEALKAGNRAADLVQQILAFSRQTEQPRQMLQLPSLVKEGLKFLRASLPATIAIEHHIAQDLEHVWGDPTRILQVLMNLCTNAAQAMGDAGGVLSIGLEGVTAGLREPSSGSHVRLTVSDTGPGIPQEIMSRIFDPDFTTKENSKGSGLGLAIVQGIVREYGGEVTVESSPGKGATFSVLLPSSRPVTHEGKKASMELAKGSGRVLFLDDEPAIERLGRLMLERLGYDVESLTDSTQAMELFRANPQAFDLVITDLTMPGIRGDRLARMIKQLRPEIPVILCTGHNDLVSPAGDVGSPFDLCLMKPVSMSDLAGAAKQLMEAGLPSAIPSE